MERSVYKVEWQGSDLRWHEVNAPEKQWAYRTRNLSRAMALAKSEQAARGRPVRVQNAAGGTIATIAGGDLIASFRTN